MRNFEKGIAPIFLIVGVVAALAVAGVGYLAFNQGVLNTKQSAENTDNLQNASPSPIGSANSSLSPSFNPLAQATPIPTPSTLDDGSWKTYSSELADFTFHYPNVSVTGGKGTAQLTFVESLSEPLDKDALPPSYNYTLIGSNLLPGYKISFTIYELGSKTLKEIADAKVLELQGSGTVATSLDDKRIGECNSIIFSGDFEAQRNFVYLEDGKGKYVEIIYMANQQNKNYKDEINKIITSFKFAN